MNSWSTKPKIFTVLSFYETGLGETFLRASGASEDAERRPIPPLISGLTVVYGDSSEPLVSAFTFPEISRKLLFV